MNRSHSVWRANPGSAALRTETEKIVPLCVSEIIVFIGLRMSFDLLAWGLLKLPNHSLN
jgi:hypothetical protein